MKIQDITGTCKYFSYAKNFRVSSNYIFLFTGRKVIILDKELRFVGEKDNLVYAYDGYLSPDKKTLLIVSAQNKFYIMRIDDFSIKKYTVNGKYNGNLESRGCWSFNGEAIFLPILNEKNALSVLRKYYIDNMDTFEDFLEEKLWITHIFSVKSIKKHLLIGLNRKNHHSYLVWFDEKKFEVQLISDFFNDCIQNVEIDENQKTILIRGYEQSIKYDFSGEKILTEAQAKTYDFLTVFAPDIQTSTVSSNQKYIYLGTNSQLVIYDTKGETVLEQMPVKFGVRKIIEISENILLLSTQVGTKIIKLTEG